MALPLDIWRHMLLWQDSELSARIAVLSRTHAQLARQYRKPDPVMTAHGMCYNSQHQTGRYGNFLSPVILQRLDDYISTLTWVHQESTSVSFLKLFQDSSGRIRNLGDVSRDGQYLRDYSGDYSGRCTLRIYDHLNHRQMMEFDYGVIFICAYEYFDRKYHIQSQIEPNQTDRYHLIGLFKEYENYGQIDEDKYYDDMKAFLERCRTFPHLEVHWSSKDKQLHLIFTLSTPKV